MIFYFIYFCLNYLLVLRTSNLEKRRSFTHAMHVNLCECDDDDEQLERCFGIVKWVRVVGEYHAIVLNIVEK